MKKLLSSASGVSIMVYSKLVVYKCKPAVYKCKPAVYKCKPAVYKCKPVVNTCKVLNSRFTTVVLISLLDTVEVTPFFQIFLCKAVVYMCIPVVYRCKPVAYTPKVC